MKIDVNVRGDVLLGLLVARGPKYVREAWAREDIEEAFRNEISHYYDDATLSVDWISDDVMWSNGTWLMAYVLEDDEMDALAPESQMLSTILREVLLNTVREFKVR